MLYTFYVKTKLSRYWTWREISEPRFAFSFVVQMGLTLFSLFLAGSLWCDHHRLAIQSARRVVTLWLLTFKSNKAKTKEVLLHTSLHFHSRALVVRYPFLFLPIKHTTWWLRMGVVIERKTACFCFYFSSNESIQNWALVLFLLKERKYWEKDVVRPLSRPLTLCDIINTISWL